MTTCLTYVDRVEELSQKLKPVSEMQDANAAVAILLKKTKADFEVLLVKRAENPADPWSGQMALPGGKRTPQDQNLVQTVLRETQEETNIDLRKNCRILGTLEFFTSTPRPELKILPFIVVIKHRPRIKLNPELVAFSWVPLQQLGSSRAVAWVGSTHVLAYVVEGKTIWGLTYVILKRFMSILDELH